MMKINKKVILTYIFSILALIAILLTNFNLFLNDYENIDSFENIEEEGKYINNQIEDFLEKTENFDSNQYFPWGEDGKIISGAYNQPSKQVFSIDTIESAYGVYVSGNFAFLAASKAGLAIINISDPTNVSVPIYKDTPGIAHNIVIEGDFAYIADNFHGLAVINISNPTNPGNIYSEDTEGKALDVKVRGNFAYLADDTEGLVIMNISDPTDPIKIANISTLGCPRAIDISGDHAFLADYDNGLTVIDISDPLNPSLPYYAPNYGYGYAWDVFVDGDVAYVADLEFGLKIFDITAPRYPELLKVITTEGKAHGIEVSGNSVYIADYTRGVSMINISDLNYIPEPYYYSTPGIALNCHIDGNYLFIADDTQGLAILQVSEPTTLEKSVVLNLNGSFSQDVEVSGDYAFVTCYEEGLAIVDIHDPMNPCAVSYINTRGEVRGVCIEGNYAYIADYSGGIAIADITNPKNPGPIYYSYTNLAPEDILVDGNYAYVADNQAGLCIFDISDPTSPQNVSHLDTHDTAKEIKIEGDYAYLVSGQYGLYIIDIKDPTNPSIITRIDTNDAYEIEISGNYAFIADRGAGLAIIDITDPSQPSAPIWRDTIGSAFGIDIEGNFAYITDASGLAVINISNPLQPGIPEYYNFPVSMYQFDGLDINGNYAFVSTTHNATLSVIQIRRRLVYDLWNDDGVIASNSIGDPQRQSVLADGVGGAYISYSSGADFDSLELYTQRFDRYGNSLFTTNIGLGAPGAEYAPRMALHENGGVYLTFEDMDPEADIWGQHILLNGDINWTVGGKGLIVHPEGQWGGLLDTLSEGGFMVIASSFQNGPPTPYVEKFDANGDSKWGGTHKSIIAEGTSRAGAIGYVNSDGSSFYEIAREISSGIFDIYVQKIDTNGNRLWGEYGVPVNTLAGNQSYTRYTSIIPDGNGNYMIFWEDSRKGDKDIYTQLINGTDGSPLWVSNGRSIVNLSGEQKFLSTVSDGDGGAWIVWIDERDGANYDKVYYQKLNANGTIEYNPNGKILCSIPSQKGHLIAKSDQNGGFVCGWQDNRTNTNGIYLQKIDRYGIVQLAVDGLRVSSETDPVILDDHFHFSCDSSNIFVSWLTFNGSVYQTYLNKIDIGKKLELIYSTFLGGIDHETTYKIKYDKDGYIYIAGGTMSSDFPTTSGAYDETHGGSVDGFICKLTPDGKNLVYSTYLGGTLRDDVLGLDLDNNGCAYVVGQTYSPEFPVTSGAFDESWNGGSRDGFICKLSADGSKLEYSSFIGTDNQDRVDEIVLNESGNLYITGFCYGSGFPTTLGAFDETYNGGIEDNFISVFSPNCSEMLYSTYLGGNGEDRPNCLVLDNDSSVYLSGYTESNDFPTTLGAYDETHNGGVRDGFVCKLSPNLATMEFCTYIGGNGNDHTEEIKLDKLGNIYGVGRTSSTNLYTHEGAYGNKNNGLYDSYIYKLNQNGSAILHATYLGRTGDDFVNCLILDEEDTPYISGLTYSPDFPTTFDAHDYSYNGTYNAYLCKFSPDLITLDYSTLLGANTVSYFLNINKFGYLDIIGKVYSTDYYTTPNAFDKIMDDVASDIFFMRFRFDIDSDKDSLCDSWEITHKLNYKNEDSDGDNMPDPWEISFSLNPLNNLDREQDNDLDGRTNYGEFLDGTDPNAPETDIYVPTIFTQKYTVNPSENDDVVINVSCYDGSGLASIDLHYSINSIPQSSTNLVAINSTHYGVNLGQFTIGTQINFYLNITDASSNQNSFIGLEYIIEIHDSDVLPPTITNFDQIPNYPGETSSVIVQCEVTDEDKGVGAVLINWRVNGGIWYRNNMTKYGPVDYHHDFGLLDINDFVEYYIEAFDNSVYNNSEMYPSINYLNFTILNSSLTDLTPPEFLLFNYSPESLITGQNFTINTTVVDSSGVESVIVYYRFGDGAWYNKELVNTVNNEYFITIGPILNSSVLYFFLEAIDMSGNANEIQKRFYGNTYFSIETISFTTGQIFPESPVITGFNPFNIGVLDEDQNQNSFKKESIEIKITTTTDPLEKRFYLVETGVNTGIFSGLIPISLNLGDSSLRVNHGDFIHVVYEDPYNETLNHDIISLDLLWKMTTNAIIISNGTVYNSHETVEITLFDNDINIDSSNVDIGFVKVISDYDLDGISIILLETGLNTGKFVGTFSFNENFDEISKSTINAFGCCNVKIEYLDEYYHELRYITHEIQFISTKRECSINYEYLPCTPMNGDYVRINAKIGNILNISHVLVRDINSGALTNLTYLQRDYSFYIYTGWVLAESEHLLFEFILEIVLFNGTVIKTTVDQIPLTPALMYVEWYPIEEEITGTIIMSAKNRRGALLNNVYFNISATSYFLDEPVQINYELSPTGELIFSLGTESGLSPGRYLITLKATKSGYHDAYSQLILVLAYGAECFVGENVVEGDGISFGIEALQHCWLIMESENTPLSTELDAPDGYVPLDGSFLKIYSSTKEKTNELAFSNIIIRILIDDPSIILNDVKIYFSIDSTTWIELTDIYLIEDIKWIEFNLPSEGIFGIVIPHDQAPHRNEDFSISSHKSEELEQIDVICEMESKKYIGEKTLENQFRNLVFAWISLILCIPGISTVIVLSIILKNKKKQM